MHLASWNRNTYSKLQNLAPTHSVGDTYAVNQWPKLPACSTEGKRGRGSSRSSVVRLCGILAVVAVGAYLTIKLMGVATSSSTPSVFTLAKDG